VGGEKVKRGLFRLENVEIGMTWFCSVIIKIHCFF